MRGVLLSWCLALGLGAGAGAQLLSPGELTEAHAEYEGLANCTQCHTLGEKVPDAKCLDCHDALAARIEADLGLHATFDQQCIECHSEHRGRDYEMIRWDPETFDHDLTGYPLEGGHAEVECKSCHTSDSFLGLSQDCLSCHEDEHRGQLGTDCTDCHTFADWEPVHFDHENAAFKLRGKHVDVECASCHPDGLYKPIEFTECRDCHEDHHDGQFAQDCASCHAVEGWQVSLFDHETARFKLRGQHVEVECASCHPDGLYRPLQFLNCVDCHQDPHQPSLGPTCEQCHTVAGFAEASGQFDHNTTRFPLEGAHAAVECEECHPQERFRGTPFAECRVCHEDYHQGQFVEDCASCHGVEAFRPSFFDHERSRFPLRGAHVEVACAECHPDDHFKPLETECRACHEDSHWGQFAEDCNHCHSAETWVMDYFNHDRTAFRLEGAHAGVACEKCHFYERAEDGSVFRRFKPLAMECQDCHQ